MVSQGLMTNTGRISILGFATGMMLALIGVHLLVTYSESYGVVFGTIFGALFIVMALSISLYFARGFRDKEKDVFRETLSTERKRDIRSFSRLSMGVCALIIAFGLYLLFVVYDPFSFVYLLMAFCVFLYYYFIDRGLAAGKARRA